MTCRHVPGDPNCGTYTSRYEPPPPEPKTPDAENYEIIDMARVGPHVVLTVKYPNCRSCSYEGQKIMVFLNVTEVQILKWRKIDPHFRDPKDPRAPNSREAPSPAARFPASQEGLSDAIDYANKKAGKRT
jgi:hypothetical protein